MPARTSDGRTGENHRQPTTRDGRTRGRGGTGTRTTPAPPRGGCCGLARAARRRHTGHRAAARPPRRPAPRRAAAIGLPYGHSARSTTIKPAVPTKATARSPCPGTVTNNGKTTITDAHLGVRIGPGGPLTTRSAMKSAAEPHRVSATPDGDEITGHTVEVRRAPRGLSTPFTLKVPVSALDLDGDGVYQLGVTLDGETAAEPTSTSSASSGPSCPGTPPTSRQAQADPDQLPVAAHRPAAHRRPRRHRLPAEPDLPRRRPGRRAGARRPAPADGRAGEEPPGDLGHRPGSAGHGRRHDQALPGRGPRRRRAPHHAGHRLRRRQAVAERPQGGHRGRPGGGAAVRRHRPRPRSPTTAQGVAGTLTHLKTATELGASTVDTILGRQHPTTDVAWPVDGADRPVDRLGRAARAARARSSRAATASPRATPAVHAHRRPPDRRRHDRGGRRRRRCPPPSPATCSAPSRRPWPCRTSSRRR